MVISVEYWKTVNPSDGGESTDVLRVATTVTFEAKDAKACERARERKLHSSVLYPRNLAKKSCRIRATSQFLGLTPINEKPNPQFEYEDALADRVFSRH